MFNKSMLPLVIVFLVIGICIIAFRQQLLLNGLDWQVLLGGNIFIYLVTVVSMHLLNKGLNAINTQAFIRHAYSGILIKLFACAGAAFAYILYAGKSLNKASLFACMGLYLIYTFIELRIILQQSKAKKHG